MKLGLRGILSCALTYSPLINVTLLLDHVNLYTKALVIMIFG